MSPISAKLERDKVLPFLKSGRATFTLKSLRTNKHYTFKMVKNKPKPDMKIPKPYSLYILTGEDYKWCCNFNDFLQPNGGWYDSPALKGFCWFLRTLIEKPHNLDQLELWHMGRCGRCGKELTDPESIQRGLGPICAEM